MCKLVNWQHCSVAFIEGKKCIPTTCVVWIGCIVCFQVCADSIGQSYTLSRTSSSCVRVWLLLSVLCILMFHNSQQLSESILFNLQCVVSQKIFLVPVCIFWMPHNSCAEFWFPSSVVNVVIRGIKGTQIDRNTPIPIDPCTPIPSHWTLRVRILQACEWKTMAWFPEVLSYPILKEKKTLSRTIFKKKDCSNITKSSWHGDTTENFEPVEALLTVGI